MALWSRKRAFVAGTLGTVAGLIPWVGPPAARPQRTRVRWQDYGSVIDWTVRRTGLGPGGWYRTVEVTHWRASDGDAGQLDDVRAAHARSPIPPAAAGVPVEFDDRRPQHLVWAGNPPPAGRPAAVWVYAQGSSSTLPYSLLVVPCAAVAIVAGVPLAAASVGGRRRR